MMNNHNEHSKFKTRDHRGHGPRGFGPAVGPEWAEKMRARAEEFGAPGPHGAGDRPFGPGFGSPRGGFGPGGPGFGPGAGFGERRAPRGSINIALMDLLLDGESNGYGLIQKFSERSNGKWAPQSGTVYPALGKLVSQQLLSVNDEGVYLLTASGRKTAEASHVAVQSIFDHMSTEDAGGDLFRSNKDLMKAMWTLYMQGTAEQQSAIMTKVDDLRKEIYRTLGE